MLPIQQTLKVKYLNIKSIDDLEKQILNKHTRTLGTPTIFTTKTIEGKNYRCTETEDIRLLRNLTFPAHPRLNSDLIILYASEVRDSKTTSRDVFTNCFDFKV